MRWVTQARCGSRLSWCKGTDVRSQIETSLVPYILELIEKADVNHDEKIDYDEWKVLGEYALQLS